MSWVPAFYDVTYDVLWTQPQTPMFPQQRPSLRLCPPPFKQWAFSSHFSTTRCQFVCFDVLMGFTFFSCLFLYVIFFSTVNIKRWPLFSTNPVDWSVFCLCVFFFFVVFFCLLADHDTYIVAGYKVGFFCFVFLKRRNTLPVSAMEKQRQKMSGGKKELDRDNPVCH